jgi:hypothetical protein
MSDIKWGELAEKEKTRLLLAYVMGCYTFTSEQAYLDCMERTKRDHHSLPSGFHWPVAYWNEAIERWLVCDQSHDPQPFNPLHDLNATWQLVERVTHPPKKALGFRSPNVLFSHWWDHAHLWAETKEEAAEAICLAALTCYLGEE